MCVCACMCTGACSGEGGKKGKCFCVSSRTMYLVGNCSMLTLLYSLVLVNLHDPNPSCKRYLYFVLFFSNNISSFICVLTYHSFLQRHLYLRIIITALHESSLQLPSSSHPCSCDLVSRFL